MLQPIRLSRQFFYNKHALYVFYPTVIVVFVCFQIIVILSESESFLTVVFEVFNANAGTPKI